MKKEIIIDNTLCRKCNVCVEVCPNVIFKKDNNLTRVKFDLVFLDIDMPLINVLHNKKTEDSIPNSSPSASVSETELFSEPFLGN